MLFVLGSSDKALYYLKHYVTQQIIIIIIGTSSAINIKLKTELRGFVHNFEPDKVSLAWKVEWSV